MSKPDPVMQALLHPFERGLAEIQDGALLIANAVAIPGLRQGTVWQWWKGAADELQSSGFAVEAAAPPGGKLFQTVLVRVPRQREEGQSLLAAAWDLLAPGGLMVAAAANDAGGGRLESDLAPYWPAMQTAAKHKCRIVWTVKARDLALPDSWRARGALQRHPQTGLWTQPGLFSWDRTDPATALLLPFIPPGLAGTVADLGCGTGVIADTVLRTSPDVKIMVCADADARAIAACRRTLEERHPGRRADYLWADLGRPGRLPQADAVIMNPPFHSEKTLALHLGQAFIVNAAAMLKKGGLLLMVANAHLPYEEMLAKNFAAVDKKFEGQGFKIFAARR